MKCYRGANVWSTLGTIISSASSLSSVAQHIKGFYPIRISNAKKVYIISYAGAGYPLVEFLNARGSYHLSLPRRV